tara:strand:- start:1839 stop:2375 length:537 start_codon:yes stop_codon:yes gene_type:complete
MADKINIDWKEFNSLVEKVAIQIDDANFKPDLIVGIMRGAAAIIDILSRIFKVKTAYLAASSYTGEMIEDQQAENIIFAREMSSTMTNFPDKMKILVVDDLTDTGKTLNYTIKYLKEYPQLKNKIAEIKTCVLFQKPKSSFNPDFVGKKLSKDFWLILPTEPYEEIRVDQLRKKYQKK